MIRLKTLGTPKLERDDGLPGAEATQRRPLAQTLYALRRDLSGAEVVVGTSSLRLNSLTIETDVAKFEDAVTRGDADRAAALYGGPFLDGFHIGAAPEFERWMESERGRLNARAQRAFERAARDATARGDHHRAVDWWRRVVALDPLDAAAAAALIEALAVVGDRSDAAFSR